MINWELILTLYLVLIFILSFIYSVLNWTRFVANSKYKDSSEQVVRLIKEMPSTKWIIIIILTVIITVTHIVFYPVEIHKAIKKKREEKK